MPHHLGSYALLQLDPEFVRRHQVNDMLALAHRVDHVLNGDRRFAKPERGSYNLERGYSPIALALFPPPRARGGPVWHSGLAGYANTDLPGHR